MSVRLAYEALCALEDVDVALDVPLAFHTTYRIGGPADLMATVGSREALARVLQVLCEERVPWFVLGGGSNVLAADEGYRGCVLRLGGGLAELHVAGTRVTTGAGVMLPKLVRVAQREGCSGLECCAGIPGTVGGAIAMDAGSRHHWIGPLVRELVCLDPTDGIVRHRGSDVVWGYRHTSLPSDQIVLEATLGLEASTPEAVDERMRRRLERRHATQPVGAACCGSVFRNPEAGSVGRMLDECGLKGRSVGGARVSDVHANFVVNTGSAQASDVRALMGIMHDAVQERFGVDLTPEVKLLGCVG